MPIARVLTRLSPQAVLRGELAGVCSQLAPGLCSLCAPACLNLAARLSLFHDVQPDSDEERTRCCCVYVARGVSLLLSHCCRLQADRH